MPDATHLATVTPLHDHSGDDALVASWLLSMHDKAAGTRTVYRSSLRGFTTWLRAEKPGVDLLHVTAADCRAHLTYLAAEGREGNTRRNRWTVLRSFYRWLVDEDELDVSPMAKVSQPKATAKPVDVLTEAQLTALLDACKGRDFQARRDLAIFRMFGATGMRIGELTALTLADIDLSTRLVVIRHGKGDRARVVRVDPATASAIDRYLRARARHKFAALPALFISHQGRLRDVGVQHMLKRRAAEAGVPTTVHPHMFRHTFAHRFLSNGGQEGDLARLGGWESAEVMRRYGSSVATERALAAYDAVSPMGNL
jgi:site-specific recombinase XerD